MRRYWAVISLLVITVLVFNRWFLTFNLLTYGDWGFYFKETQKELLRYPFLWSKEGMGGVDLQYSFYVSKLFWGLIAYVGSFSFSERLLYMWPAAVIASLGSYALTKRLTSSNWAGFVGALVYSYNTYSLTIVNAHLTIYMSYALAPLIIFLVLKGKDEKDLRFTVGAALMSFLSVSYEARVFYLTAFVIAILGTLWLLTEKDRWSIVKTLAVYVTVTGLLSSYWLLALHASGSLAENSLFDQSLYGSNLFNLSRSITLFHPYWTFGKAQSSFAQPVSWYYWAIPVLAAAGIAASIKKKPIILFLPIVVIGVLLGKETAAPFPGLYVWVWNHVPGFKAFREASKFYFLISLGYSVFIAALTAWLVTSNTARVVKVVGVGLIMSLFLINTWPIITGQSGTLFQARSVPPEYVQLKDYLASDKDFGRTLWLPISSRWGYYSSTHPSVNGNVFVSNFSPDRTTDIEILMVSVFTQADFHDYLNSHAIKYVIVPLKDTANDDNFYVDFGNNRQMFIDHLDQVPYLHRIDKFTDLAVYQNDDAWSEFTFVDRFGHTSSLAATATSSGWRLDLSDQNQDGTLVFSDAYSSQLFLTGNQKGVGFASQKWGDLNSFPLQKPGPTVNVVLVAQKSANIGLAITITALLCSLGFLIVTRKKGNIV